MSKTYSKRSAGKKRCRLVVYMSHDHAKRIRAMAKKRGISVSSFLEWVMYK